MSRYKVRGGGQFPISMLRFDRSWPVSDVDAGKIADMGHDQRPAAAVRTGAGPASPPPSEWT